MHTQQDVIETLKSAKSLLETKGHTRGTFARSKDGEACGYGVPEAAYFCSIGAIRRAIVDRGFFDPVLGGSAEDYLENSYGGPESIVSWNDAPTRTREEVLHTFSLAIQMAEKDLAADEGDLAESAAEVLPGVAANAVGVVEAA